MSGDTTTETKQKSAPPSYAKPAIKGYLAQAQQLSQQPYQPYTGEMLAPFDPLQSQAFDLMQQYGTQDNPYQQAAGNQYLSMMSPDYLIGGPELNNLVSTAQGDIVDQFNNQVQPNSVYEFAKYGGGNISNTGLMQTDAMNRFSLARALGDTENQIRGGAYQAALGRQAAAMPFGLQLAQQPLNQASALMQAGSMKQAQAQQALNIPYSQFLEQRQYPYQQLDVMGRAIPIATGNYGVNIGTTTQPGPNPIMLGLGTALMGADIGSKFLGNPFGGAASPGTSPYLSQYLSPSSMGAQTGIPGLY